MLASILGLTTLRLLGPDIVNQQELRAFLEPLGRWAPLVFILFLAIRPVTLLPGQLFTAVGGMLFGTLPAVAYSLVGSFFAAALLFCLSRWLGTRLMKRMAGGKYPAVTRAAHRHGFKFALLTCLNPLLPTDVMLGAAAAAGARFWPLVAGVLLGTIPGTFLTAQFGSGLAQGQTLETVLSGAGMVVSLVLGGLLGRRIYRELGEDDAPAPQPRPPSEARRQRLGAKDGPELPLSSSCQKLPSGAPWRFPA